MRPRTVLSSTLLAAVLAACSTDPTGPRPGVLRGNVAAVDPADVELTYVCQNIFRIVNATDADLTLDWWQVETQRRDTLDVAAGDTAYFSTPTPGFVQLYLDGVWIGTAFNTGIATCPTSDILDVKPGEWPNSINLKARGVLPVAILTTPFLDATTIDISTVTLGGVHVSRKPNGDWHASYEDVDGDGDLDLVLHFRIQELVAGGVLSPSTTAVTISGSTSSFTFSDTDDVRIVNW